MITLAALCLGVLIGVILGATAVAQLHREKVPQDLRVELSQHLDEPVECRVYQHNTLLFDGVDRSVFVRNMVFPRPRIKPPVIPHIPMPQKRGKW